MASPRQHIVPNEKPGEMDCRDRISQFRKPYRRYIEALTSCSDRMSELAETFPGLLFALATGYGTPEQRERCFDHVINGESLRDSADALGVPLWMRPLPPAAYTERLYCLPMDPGFARRIGNFIPARPQDAPSWLLRVLHAHAVLGEDYALWMARQTRVPFERHAKRPLVRLAAWAWYSAQPGTLGHALVRRAWDPELSLKRAQDEARYWFRRVELAVALGDGITDTWFCGGTVGRYEFVPLTTIDEFLGEAEAMSNCLDQYGDRIASGTARIFSIRVDGTAVANLEIVPHDDDCLMPAITQLRAPRNGRVCPEIWQAAYAWLGGQRFRRFSHVAQGVDRASARRTWEEIWSPYLRSLAGTPCQSLARRVALKTRLWDAGEERTAGVTFDE